MAQQPKVVKVGPGGRSNGPRPKVENPGKVFKRILAYVMSRYKAQVIVVLCCILLAVFAQLQGVQCQQGQRLHLLPRAGCWQVGGRVFAQVVAQVLVSPLGCGLH